MSVGRSTLTLLACVALSLVGALPVVAQQTTGTPGAPSATSAIDGRQIPPPPASFGGTINLDALNSTPPQVVPPKGAPNILLIITDDVGFAAPSTFGGVIPTPTLDRIANMGAALHAVSHHLAVLAHACRPDHRAQSSLRGFRRDKRSLNRLSRL